jgi:hypothetical protein
MAPQQRRPPFCARMVRRSPADRHEADGRRRQNDRERGSRGDGAWREDEQGDRAGQRERGRADREPILGEAARTAEAVTPSMLR